MAAPCRVIELAFTQSDLVELMMLARSRTEPANRVGRARMGGWLTDYEEQS